MRFQTTAFNRHLANIGQQVMWARSFACPCLNPASGQPDPRCPQCQGKGHLWNPAIKTVCGIASQNTQKSWAQSGMWTDGDMVITIPANSPAWDMGQFDRVTMLNDDERFSMSLVRGAPTERLLFKAHKIERVFWLHPQTKAMVEGGIPTIDDAGRPSWAAGAPPAGVSYSITGQRRPEYYCLTQMPSSRNEHSGMPLPVRAVLRRFDLLGRRSAT